MNIFTLSVPIRRLPLALLLTAAAWTASAQTGLSGGGNNAAVGGAGGFVTGSSGSTGGATGPGAGMGTMPTAPFLSNGQSQPSGLVRPMTPELGQGNAYTLRMPLPP